MNSKAQLIQKHSNKSLPQSLAPVILKHISLGEKGGKKREKKDFCSVEHSMSAVTSAACLHFIALGRRIKGDDAWGSVLNNKRERKNNIIYDKNQHRAYKHIYQRELWCCHRDSHPKAAFHLTGGRSALHTAFLPLSTEPFSHSL